MRSKYTEDFYNWLLKETPEEGGCMLCLVTYDFKDYSIEEKKYVLKERKEYFLVQKREIANGYMFTMNGRFFYDYDFIWENGNKNNWEILYKKNV